MSAARFAAIPETRAKLKTPGVARETGPFPVSLVAVLGTRLKCGFTGVLGIQMRCCAVIYTTIRIEQ